MTTISTDKGRIGFVERGNGTGLPILFLHGVGSDKTVWAPQIAHFGQTRRAVALDYPGYGESEPAADESDHDDFAAATLAAMDALSIGQAHVCGLSLGGVVAIAMHARAPERCASLIIADSFAVHPEGQAIHDRSIKASREIGMRGLAEQRAPLLLAPDTPAATRSAVVETMAGIDPGAYRTGVRAVWLADQRARVRAIETPTLVLVGDLDPVTPPELSWELSAMIPGSRLVQIAGASHIANLDKPAEFNAAIDDFLSELEQAG